MTRVAQVLSGLVALFLAFFAFRYAFTPDSIAPLNGLAWENTFGKANFRAQAAPMFMIAILAAIAAARKSWEFIVPAALYFLMLIVVRIVSLISDGFDTGTMRATILALVLFVVAEVALQIFRKAERREAE